MADYPSHPGRPTAWERRDALPDLSSWMSEEALKLIPIWQGRRLETGQVYFNLKDPDRSAFTATGDETPLAGTLYACRREVPEWVWAQLITWRQPVDDWQAESIAALTRTEEGGTGY